MSGFGGRFLLSLPLQPTEMFSSMTTSFSPPQTATKPNLEFQPPYVVETHICETTTYGGDFKH
jgi:hypothetical protein